MSFLLDLAEDVGTFHFVCLFAVLLFHSESFVSSSLQRRIQAGLSISCMPLMQIYALRRVLRYVKSAVGETDVPDSLPEFIGQRRRWLNGSFFAATYSIAHTGQVLRSGHSVGRKVVLLVETMYNTINLVFSWFSVVSPVSACERE